MTPAEIAALVEALVGPRPRLWLPARLLAVDRDQGPAAKSGPEVVVTRTYAEVTATPSSAGDLWEDLRAFDLLPAVVKLAGLNVLLEASPRDIGLQQAAADRYVRPAYRSAPARDPNFPPPDYEFIFNRVGVLIALKGAIGVAAAASVPHSSEDYRIGDSVLRANDFVSSASFQQRTTVPRDLDIAAEILPIWELTNPRDLGYGMARMYRMLEYLGGVDPIVSAIRDKLGLVIQDLRFDGLPVGDFVGVVFGLCAHARNAPPNLLLQNPSACALDRERFLSQTRFPQSILDQFLSVRSRQASRLRDMLTGDTPWNRDRFVALMTDKTFAVDFLTFRKYPLLDLGGDNYLILDVQFLAELLFSGLFFHLLFELPSAKREDFLSLWGRIFELSVFELLEHYYPAAAGILQTDVTRYSISGT